ncbi:hypothetical protein [Microbacterium sp. NIBRBAC000506063]
MTIAINWAAFVQVFVASILGPGPSSPSTRSGCVCSCAAGGRRW